MTRLTLAQAVLMLEGAEASTRDGIEIAAFEHFESFHAWAHGYALEQGQDVPDRWEEWSPFPEDIFVDVDTDELVVVGCDDITVEHLRNFALHVQRTCQFALDRHQQALADPKSRAKARLPAPASSTLEPYAQALHTASNHAQRVNERCRVLVVAADPADDPFTTHVSPDGSLTTRVNGSRVGDIYLTRAPLHEPAPVLRTSNT